MSLPPAPVRIVHFGVFEADFQAGELRKAGIRVKLHDQSLQILAMLLEHPGALVTREEIKNKLWPRDTFVDFDHGLNNAVNRLRTAIGDAADSPRWIETLPRRGYRFIGPANQAERSSADIVVSDVPLGEDVRMDPATASRAEQVKFLERRNYRWLLWVAPVATVLALLAPFGLKKPSDVPSSRSFVLPPEGTTLNLIGDDGGSVALSADGTRLAFVAVNAKGSSRIWVRSLGKLKAEEIAGTEGATFPFWSPSGRSLGFFADAKLKTIGLDGGSAVALCDAPFGRGGSWSRRGLIIFAPDSHTSIYKISDSGGTPSPVTKIDAAIHTTHRWPRFLPDGLHFTYLAANHFRDGSHNGVYLGSIEGGESKLLIASDADATYASGYLFFLRNNVLMAQKFDPERGQLYGQPRPTVERVLYDPSIWKAVFDSSENGVMAYLLGDSVAGTQLSWFDRAGNKLSDVGEPNFQYEPRLSPNGQRLAVGIGDGGYSHVWVYELGRGSRMQVTFGMYDNGSATWSPDGSQLLIAAKRKHYSIYRVDSSGAMPEQLLLDTGSDTWPLDLSPDGRFLLFGQGINIGRVRSTLWIYKMSGDSSPSRLLQGDALESEGQFSPDGRWIAYTCNQSGRDEVYVIPFRATSGSPEGGYNAGTERVQVSLSGGHRPRWRRDGREICYMATDNAIMAVPVVSRGPRFEVGTAHPLFRANPGFTIFPYDVSPSGNKFIIITAAKEKTEPITLVENWPSDFR